MIERLVEIAQQARVAPFGRKEAVYKAACEELGLTRATLLRKLKEVAFSAPRKQRADKGETSVSHADAQKIAAYIKAHTRQTGKQLMTLERTLEILRSNSEINIDSVDEETGEVKLLAISTVRRALKNYGLDVETLNAPAPAVQMASKHPNHLWQIDASICVLYYLPKSGLQVMEESVFEKNKPENFKKAEQDRVWRFLVVDHCSGAIYVEYLFGGENTANLINVFLNAIHQRDGKPFYGVPFCLYMDAASANKSSTFRNLCRSLQVDLAHHLPGNSRATGSVEKAQDIVERQFEACLKSVAVTSLDQLNQVAGRWMTKFNAYAIHSRHQMTRYGAWLKIKDAQLRIAPPIELCRELARSAPIERTVSSYLTIDFKGTEYDVSSIPDVHVNKKVLVCVNPYRADTVQIVQTDEEGHDKFFVVEAAIKDNEFGFYASANVYGQGYARHAETTAEKQTKQLDQLITGKSTEKEIKKSLSKDLPFNGRIDAFKPMDDFIAPTFMPRQGTALNVPDLAVPEIKPLTLIETKMRLRNLLGRAVTPAENNMLRETYPDGVMEDQLTEIVEMIDNNGNAPRLVAVG